MIVFIRLKYTCEVYIGAFVKRQTFVPSQPFGDDYPICTVCMQTFVL